MHGPLRALAVAALLVTRLAGAQPAPTPDPGDRVDAKALVQTGIRLLEAKDYLGALAIFKDAYARFPSAKILLNVGTTFRLLGRDADAANAYQRYLDASGTEASRRAEVEEVIAELDKGLGRLRVSVAPAGAEILVGDEWIAATSLAVLHVPPGEFVVRARHAGYQDGEQSGTVAAEQEAGVSLTLTVIPDVKPTIVEVPRAEGPRARLGVIAVVHVSVAPKLGSAWLIGATFDARPALALEGAVLLGPGLVSDGMSTLPPPSFGAYAGARYAFVTGSLRPHVAAGVPVFFSDGARVFLRGGVGVEYVATRHLAVTLTLGAEIAANPQNDIRGVAIVPALGVSGRL